MRSDAATWKPACPAPKTTTPSGFIAPSLLGLGRSHNQAFEFLTHRYLAAQTAVGTPLRSRGIEHLILVFLDRLQQAEKCFVHINVAGGALARPATLGDNAVDSILNGALHNRVTDGHGHLTSVARIGDIGHCGGVCLFFSKEAHDCRLILLDSENPNHAAFWNLGKLARENSIERVLTSASIAAPTRLDRDVLFPLD